MKIKLIQFISNFSVGGAENLVKQYCQMFDGDKVDLLVLALHNYHSVFDKELSDAGLNVIYVDDIIDKAFFLFPVIVQKAMHRVFRKILVKSIILKFNPDVIHYHILLSEYLKFVKPKIGTKIFLTVHNEPKMLWSNEKDRVKDKRATEWLVRHYRFKFLTLHDTMRKEVNVLFNVKDSLVINNGVMAERFRVRNKQDEFKKILQIPESAVVIGHIGRFIAVKNHLFMIDIFEEYMKINQDAILIFVGTGVLQDEIKVAVEQRKLANKVLFLGIRADIPEILHIMNIMLFPSIYEGLPVTLIEAQVSETPCLVSDTVAKEVKISNLLWFESLDKTSEEWAKKIDEIIHFRIQADVHSEDWNMVDIVRKLENLYGT